MRALTPRLLSVIVTLAVTLATAAAPRGAAALSRLEPPADSTTAVAVVSAFHTALVLADSAAVFTVLAPDVQIMEGGDIETLSDYRSHHLAEDIAYARAIPGVHTIRHVVVQRDVAWVSSTSIIKGRIKGRIVDVAGAELVVLSRVNATAPWRIRAVHWSSHRRSS